MLGATVIAAALIVTVLLLAGCGLTTTRAATSGSHLTATPTSVILSGASLSWTVGNLPPNGGVALGDV
jgi:hypothetical protein